MFCNMGYEKYLLGARTLELKHICSIATWTRWGALHGHWNAFHKVRGTLQFRCLQEHSSTGLRNIRYSYFFPGTYHMITWLLWEYVQQTRTLDDETKTCVWTPGIRISGVLLPPSDRGVGGRGLRVMALSISHDYPTVTKWAGCFAVGELSMVH